MPDSAESEGPSGKSRLEASSQASSLTLVHSGSHALTGANTEPTLKRPTTKPRKGTSLRKAFGPSAVEDEDSESSGVVTPKRANLSRIAVQRNAFKKSTLSGSTFPRRGSEDDDDGPSYSAASLQQLKNSTPTTPRDLATEVSNSEVEEISSDTQALDLTSKFGSSLGRYQQPSAIPSAAEIAEKKARRARLANEDAADEYLSLNPSDPEIDSNEDLDDNVMRDENGRLVLKPKDKYQNAESRMVRDDEDMMEDFDDFTEADGKILLGRKAEAEAARKRKQEMAAQIAAAEGASDSDSDASERERKEAFEAAQTKHGAYGGHDSGKAEVDARPRTPPIITPIPTLDSVIERLQKQVLELQTSRMQKLQDMEALQREKVRLGEEEVRIQKALRDTADKYAALRAEKGISAPSAELGRPGLLEAPSARWSGGDGGESGASTDVEMNGGRMGLGFGRGLESLGGSGLGTPLRQDGEDVDESI